MNDRLFKLMIERTIPVTPEEKVTFIKESLSNLSAVDNKTELRNLLRKISDRSGLSEEVILTELKGFKKRLEIMDNK